MSIIPAVVEMDILLVTALKKINKVEEELPVPAASRCSLFFLTESIAMRYTDDCVFSCGQEGHFARDCPEPRKGGGACHK
jgi:hypothetical protein